MEERERDIDRKRVRETKRESVKSIARERRIGRETKTETVK